MANIAKSLRDSLRARLLELVDVMIDQDPDRAIELALGSASFQNNAEANGTTIRRTLDKTEPVLPVRVTRQNGKAVQTADNGRTDTGRQRFATKAYAVKRNRVGNPVAEPERESDKAAYRFLVRHRKPVTIIELEQATGLSNSQLRNNLFRMQRDGVIETIKIAD